MLKLSFSILQFWQSNQIDKAISALMGDWDNEKTPAMEKGIEIHEKIATKKLKPFIWMKNGKYEQYIRISINQWISFGGYIDWNDSDIIIDWKTGATQSNQFNKLQLFCYGLLIPTATKGIFAHIDDSCNVLDYSIYKISQHQKELAINYIETIAGEIYQAINN